MTGHENVLFDGKYKIIKELGSGGMGSVYLAENVKLKTLWAVKRIPKNIASGNDPQGECEILKKLSHPSLPRIYDIIEDKDFVYLIVDYIKGDSLDKILAGKVCFDERTVVDWGIQICGVLEYLHGIRPNPVIYRDMKPSNIILTEEGTLKLVDFGIAREYKEEKSNDTVYIGTRGYAAPEQYGSGQSNHLTDIYSLGVTLHELVTGISPNKPPYELVPFSQVQNQISYEFESVIKKCTRPEPDLRYKSAGELKKDLLNLSAVLNQYKGKNDLSAKSVSKSFKRLVITVWNNAEFAGELAYIAAKMSTLEVLLIDLDLLAPKIDLVLNIKKYPSVKYNNGLFRGTGLNIVLDAIEKNKINARVFDEASIKRTDAKRLSILTGCYNLEDYEYYSNETLLELINEAYKNYDLTILAVNKSIYDAYTLIALNESDYNIIPLKAHTLNFREYNSYIAYLAKKQNIPIDKYLFAAFDYSNESDIEIYKIKEITQKRFLGTVGKSLERYKCRSLKAPYVKRMEKSILKEYENILALLNIIPKKALIKSIIERIKGCRLKRDSGIYPFRQKNTFLFFL